MDGLRLNIGSGGRALPGFVNVDLEPGGDICWDVTRGLPFPDRSIDAVYSEHFIEHLSQAEGAAFLRECRRVLAPGGRVRIATPDLDHVAERYASNWRGQSWIHDFGYEWIDNPCEMFNTLMREWGHRWVYNEEELVRLARFAGLVPLARPARGESDVEALRGLEWREDSILILEFGRRADVRAVLDPMVSILIPAYRPDFFNAALASAREQAWDRLEILVCDDSPGDAIERATRAAAESDPRVRYIRNAKAEGSAANYARCIAAATGDFLKFLNDDDLLHPECVPRMAGALLANPHAAIAASRRGRIDAHGAPLADTPETTPLARHDCVIEGASLAAHLLSGRMNDLGEPTTVMFRRADLAHVRPGPVSYGGRPATWNVDVAMWLNLLGQGDAIWFAEPLSWFRSHAGQETHDPAATARAAEAWDHMGLHARRLGLWDPAAPSALDIRPPQPDCDMLARFPGLVDALSARALELSARAKYRASADILRRVVAIQPGLARAHLELGLALYAQDDILPAIESLAKAMELDPHTPGPMRALAETLRRRVAPQPAAA